NHSATCPEGGFMAACEPAVKGRAGGCSAPRFGAKRDAMNSVYAGLKPTIFETMSGLAAELGAINLGQAFPEGDGPLDVRERAAQAMIEGQNQYPPMRGLPALREAVAEHYRTHQGVELDWKTEVTITSGATEALGAALLAVIEPGDEVVL